MTLLLAHAQWFVDRARDFPVEWSRLTGTATLAAVSGTAAGGVAIGALARSLPAARQAPVPSLRRLADWLPALVGVTLGLGLLGLTLLGYAWTPAIRAADVSGLLVVAQTVIGGWLVLGVARREAALAALALTAIVAVAVDPLAVMAAAYIPGAAFALLGFATRGGAGALASLRIGVGIGLIAAAVIEKLAVPAMMVTVVEAHPQLNVLGDAGLATGPQTFTLVAGCAELLLGGLLVAGVGGQIVALAALGPLVATVPLFGVTELVGHLPIYGVLLAIAVLAVPRVAPDRVAP